MCSRRGYVGLLLVGRPTRDLACSANQGSAGEGLGPHFFLASPMSAESTNSSTTSRRAAVLADGRMGAAVLGVAAQQGQRASREFALLSRRLASPVSVVTAPGAAAPEPSRIDQT